MLQLTIQTVTKAEKQFPQKSFQMVNCKCKYKTKEQSCSASKKKNTFL